MKNFDIYEYLADFVSDGKSKDGDEILINIDGRKICVVTPQFKEEEISFKIVKRY
ncbi:hypothetical protein TCA2_4419 [Paenibacillus sp. TCA20]|uniref:hypothetical protein n=1 Tax=Paenibacillus sp. FSL H7-0326 TaxID=1921144 RepID=UPI0004D9A90D|nr:hypothetical protein [Paenibacillus sp. FSL H7-0326]GAK41927.1 hypothetical protein TCA2_4419 [Paenibacillus sp. TCA20]